MHRVPLPAAADEPDRSARRPPSPMVGKNPGFFKKPSLVGFFLVWFFFGFFLFFLYICPEERVFSVFSVTRILLGASRL
jgi:hypothetical protein